MKKIMVLEGDEETVDYFIMKTEEMRLDGGFTKDIVIDVYDFKERYDEIIDEHTKG